MTIGQGVLNWVKYERQSDRYGAVHLDGPDGDALADVELPIGRHGRLVATIVTARPRVHLGDWARGIAAQPAAVGSEFVMGEGEFFQELMYDQVQIGVKPDDGRTYDWMDPHVLYQLHNQEVRIAFEEAEPA